MKELVLGIGNALNGDDGIGSYVAGKISRRAGEELKAIDGSTAPESYTSIIRRHNPDRLILVDAADMGLSPGSYRIIPASRIGVVGFSTHQLPLTSLIDYLSQDCGEIVLIGIQPETTATGAPLSSAVQQSGDAIVRLITEKRLNDIEPLAG